MKLKNIFPIFLMILFVSCSAKTSFKDEMILKDLPTNTIASTDIGLSLNNYAKSINQINYNKTLSLLKTDVKKDDFRKRMIDFRIIYNKCVDKMNEFGNANENDKVNKMAELKELKYELDAIWLYIVNNYKI